MSEELYVIVMGSVLLFLISAVTWKIIILWKEDIDDFTRV